MHTDPSPSVRTSSSETDSGHPHSSSVSSSLAVSSRISSINHSIWSHISSRRAEWGFTLRQLHFQLQLPYCGTLSTRSDPEPESRSYAPTQPTSSATTLGRSYRQIPASRRPLLAVSCPGAATGGSILGWPGTLVRTSGGSSRSSCSLSPASSSCEISPSRVHSSHARWAGSITPESCEWKSRAQTPAYALESTYF